MISRLPAYKLAPHETEHLHDGATLEYDSLAFDHHTMDRAAVFRGHTIVLKG